NFKGLNCVLIVGRGEDDLGQGDLLIQQFFDHAKAVEARHLHVEKEEVRREFLDEVDGLKPVVALRDHVDILDRLEQIAQLVAGELLIIDNDGGKRQPIFSCPTV